MNFEKVVAQNVAGDVKLEDGQAYRMGEGLFVIDQEDLTAPEGRARNQRIVVTSRDLEAMQGCNCLTMELEDGTAENMGDGIWIVLQHDETVGAVQNVVLNDNDRALLLAVA